MFSMSKIKPQLPVQLVHPQDDLLNSYKIIIVQEGVFQVIYNSFKYTSKADYISVLLRDKQPVQDYTVDLKNQPNTTEKLNAD